MPATVDVSKYKGIWVFVEQNLGQSANVSFELIGKGRELADKLSVPLTAFVIGESMDNLAVECLQSGADRVIVADHPVLKQYRTELYAKIIAEKAREEKPEILLVGASPIGRDLAPTLSFRLNAGCTADCTSLDIDEEKRLLVSTRPAFGGNVMATILCPEHRPQMSTVRPGVMPVPEKDTARTGEIVKLPVAFAEDDAKVKIKSVVQSQAHGVNLIEAEKVVAGGMGAGDAETFKFLDELAKLLDAEVAASRPVVETGLISHDHQVGQTGKTIRPELYMAFGISGTVQHTAGMAGSKCIVAVNKDPNAEIFKFADYGIVDDAQKIITELISHLKKEL